jgi:hypothetical protein
VQTNREIAVRDLQLLRHELRRFLLEIDSLDELGIVRTKRRQEPVKAGTDGRFHLIEGRLLIVARESQFLEKGVIATGLCTSRSIVIDERVTKDFVEPGHHTFITAYGMVTLNGSDHALLQEIINQRFVTDTTTDKHSERRPVL